MGNKPLSNLVSIDSNRIMENIKKAGYSIRSLAEKTSYSDRMIRSYLKREEMPFNLLQQIDNIARPKTHRITVQFNMTLWIADEEYDELAQMSKESGDVTLEEVDSEYLWSSAGEVQYNNAQISKNEFEQKGEPV